MKRQYEIRRYRERHGYAVNAKIPCVTQAELDIKHYDLKLAERYFIEATSEAYVAAFNLKWGRFLCYNRLKLELL